MHGLLSVIFFIDWQIITALRFDDIPASKIGPEPRQSSSSAYSISSNEIYIFGGKDKKKYFQDLWSFNLTSLTWKFIYITSTAPAPRSEAAAFFRHSENQFCIYGGKSLEAIFQDIWCFLIEKSYWQALVTTNSPILLNSFCYAYFSINKFDYLAIFEEKNNFINLLNILSQSWTSFKFNTFNSSCSTDTVSHQSRNLLHYYNSKLFVICFSREYNFQDFLTFDIVNNSSGIQSFHMPFDNKTSLQVQKSTILGENLFILFESGFICKLSIYNLTASWVPTNMYFPKMSSSAVSVSNRIILIGGLFNSTLQPVLTNEVVSYSLMENGTISSSVLSRHYVLPSPRYFHRMHVIRGEFYLFGGKTQNSILGDMWKYNPDANRWTLLSPINPPTARYEYASDSQGDLIFLWGGADGNALLNDMHIYNSLTNTWNKVAIQSMHMPSKRKSACTVLKFPIVYIVGGVDDAGICEDIWKFSFLDFSYQKIGSGYFGLNPNCYFENNTFYVVNGWIPSKKPSRLVLKDGPIGNPIGHEIFFYYQDFKAKIGGSDFKSIALNVISYELNGQYSSIEFDDFPYATASVYYKDSLYYHGGGYYKGKYVIFPTIPMPRFSKLSLKSLCNEIYCELACSEGTYKKLNSCELCPPGTYANSKGNTLCSLCPSGHYNPNYGASSIRQCLLCKEGTFSNKNGSRICKTCPHDYLCPAGSKVPIIIDEVYNKPVSIQPPLFNNFYPSKFIFILQLSGGAAVASFISLALIITKLRKIIYKIDAYRKLHNYNIGEFVQLRKNFVGGIFSIGLYGMTAISVISIMSIFILDNIQEVKALIPDLILDKQFDSFSGNFFIELNLTNYGDKCINPLSLNNICNPLIQINVQNLVFGNFSMNCHKSENNQCKISFFCKKCTIATQSFVNIALREDLSYCTGISLNITSDSSIPESTSSIYSILYTNPGNILVGPTASQFTFTLTPSYFTSTVSSFPEFLTGYHINSSKSPKSGSQITLEDLAATSQLYIQIILEKSNLGLLTTRTANRNLCLLLCSIIGSAVGIYGVIGYMMQMFESKFIKKKIKMQKQKRIETIEYLRKNILQKYFYTVFDQNVNEDIQITRQVLDH